MVRLPRLFSRRAPRGGAARAAPKQPAGLGDRWGKDSDSDSDGTADGCDPCPNDNPDDTDSDGVCEGVDACPGFDDNVDTDSDGTADG